jgi:hypothetical protein
MLGRAVACGLLDGAVMRLALVLLVGCASNPSGVTGELPGGGFEPGDQISAAVTMTEGGDTLGEARIVIASTAHLCGDASAQPPIDRKGQHWITISLRDVNGAMKSVPTAPGTYTIYPNTGSEPAKSASFESGAFSDSCAEDDAASAMGQSGTVTLTSVAGGVFAGTFDVGLNTGGRAMGSFQPAACPQLAGQATATETHACM